MAPAANPKRLAVDIGGTFTDVVLEWADGRSTAKVPTTPAAPEEGVLSGIDSALEAAAVEASEVELLVHGTTLATNAVIERKGAPTALVTTEGFRDILDTGYESRYDQYDIYLDKPVPLVPRRHRLTVRERTSATGAVLRPLDEDGVRVLVPQLEQRGITSVAIGFLHSYANASHEQRVRDLLLEALPDLYVSLSAEVCPEIREYERLSTTCANAYVQPLVAGYLTRLREHLSLRGFRCPVFMMNSGGGLMTLDAAVRFPVRLMESGPAGGAILASTVAAECELERVVSFDMGGTTAKLSLIHDFRPRTARSFEVDRAARFLKGSGLPLRIPVVEMIEIGAGGGSIARIDEMRQIAVGPDSAGADPGPACYARGGEAATVTDADLLLGRIDAEDFAGGALSLQAGLAATAIDRAIGEPLSLDRSLAAYGVSEIVDERMANAARVHAIERGEVIGEHTMVAFGGAAPLHASRVAEKLGITRIVVPTDAGVGSAVGFLRAPVAYELARSHYMRLGAFDLDGMNRILADLSAEAREVVRAGAPDEPLIEHRSAFMRYVGQGHEIVVPVPSRNLDANDPDALQREFDREYAKLYARVIPGADIEILSWVVTVSTTVAAPRALPSPGKRNAATTQARRALYDPVNDRMNEVPVYRRTSLMPGDTLSGPSLIVEAATATYVSAAFDACLNQYGHIVLERRRDERGATS